MLRDPRAIPGRTLEYARYDLVRVLNQLMDVTRISESFVEHLLAKFMAVPARRFLRMKRSVSLLVAGDADSDSATIVQGTYQSPVLVQWRQAKNRTRHLDVSLVRFA